MRRTYKIAAFFSLLVGSTIVISACGQENSAMSGDSKEILEEKAAIMPTMKENTAVESSADTNMAAVAIEPLAAEESDVASDIENVNALGLSLPADFVLPAGLPYLCNPLQYPMNIITANRDCWPYLNTLYSLWGTSYGYYKYFPYYLNRYYRGHVGSSRFYDDDDNDHYRRGKNKRFHKKDRHDNRDNKKHNRQNNKSHKKFEPIEDPIPHIPGVPRSRTIDPRTGKPVGARSI